jgi:hypothetical protein
LVQAPFSIEIGPVRSGQAAVGYWHTEGGHDVEDFAADLGIYLLSWQSPGAQAPPDYNFIAQHGDLNKRPTTVVHGPADPALLGDYGDVAIPLGGSRLGGFGGHGGGSRRNEFGARTATAW